MKNRKDTKITKAAGLLLDLIFPGHCPVCDELLKPGTQICPGCPSKIKYVREPVCAKCGKPLREKTAEYCHDCSVRKHHFIKGVSLFEYQSMAASIYRFKYGGRQEYAGYFGEKMAAHMRGQLFRWRPQAIIPVPIHSSRMRVRGYNQAEALGRIFSEETGIPLRTDIIKRCRRTEPQKNLNDLQRQNNLKRAFKIHGNDVKLDTIVIIDDIFTTGSTIDAMARELQKAGIANIYYVSLTIGRGF